MAKTASASTTKVLSSNDSAPMTRAGAPVKGKCQTYPKGSKLNLSADFNPMKAGKPTQFVSGV